MAQKTPPTATSPNWIPSRISREPSLPPRTILSLLALCAALVLVPLSQAQAQATESIVHDWKRIYYATLDGEDVLLFADGLDGIKPAFGDIDGDGDLDFLAGRSDGRIMIFENQGSSEHPNWRLVNDALRASMAIDSSAGWARKVPIDVGENATPALVDIDADDDLDLFIGSASGRLFYFRNEGNRYLTDYVLADSDFLDYAYGLNLAPAFADINGDGVPDLAVGTEAGEIFLLIGRGTRFEPDFCVSTVPGDVQCPPPPEPLVKLSLVDNAVPDWVDWDGDGNLDLMAGKSDGKIAYYGNIGTPLDPVFELFEDRFLILDAGGYAAPRFQDFNGDGLPDLFLAGSGNRIPYYSNRPQGGRPDLWLEERNVLRARSLGRFQTRLHIASGDLDGDGDADLVIGSGSGRLYVYENVYDNQNGGAHVALKSSEGPLLPTPKRAFSVPALVDLEGDGDLDLVVGDRNGRLEWIQNAGTAQKPQWRSKGLFYGEIDVGSLSAPAFYDFDGDGDPDLVVGNSLGNLIFYQNGGTGERAEFVLRSVRFGGVKVAGHAAPALFTWREGTTPDLVTGSRAGELVSAVRNEAEAITASAAWVSQGRPWRGIRVAGYSAPHFVDLTGDGRQDLIIGTADGAIVLWRYEGSRTVQRVAGAGRQTGNDLTAMADGDFVPGADLLGRGPNDLERMGNLGTAGSRPLAMDPIFFDEPVMLDGVLPGRNTFPAFADLDGDGRAEMVVGTANGQLWQFRNVGEAGSPRWEPVPERLISIDGGRNPAPVLYDLDGDGDFDLLVGTEFGRVLAWENRGSRESADFQPLPNALKAVRVKRNAVPVFYDITGDGQPELIVGSLNEGLQLYRRSEGGTPWDYELVERRYLGLNVGLNATPHLADLTMDRRPELLVGSDNGKIIVLVRTATSPLRTSGWRINTAFLEGIEFPPGSHPAVVDVDGDGDPDLFVGSDKGPIRFYRNGALVAEGLTSAN